MNRAALSAVLCLSMIAAGSFAAPTDAYYTANPNRLFWMVHVSDTHIGTDWYNEDGRFFWMLEQALPIIQPLFVVATGDLVDGSRNGIPASGQENEEWQRYREMLDQAGLSADFFIDLPGNHDTYDDDLSHYLQWSLNGSAYGKTTRALVLEFDFGTYFLYGCSTPGDKAGPFVDPAGFSQAELDEMQQMLEGNMDANLVLVFGHHPPSTPDRADEARAMWRQAGAQYFHGHSHMYEEYIYDGVLTRQVNSLGKATTDNLAVIAVDGDFVTYHTTSSDDPWPMVVITAPAGSRLDNGDENPYAYPVPVGCRAVPVRALVFDNAPVERVWLSATGGPDVEMWQDPARPMLWLGEWDTTGLSGGEMELAVSATGSRSRTRTITVKLSAGAGCPEPYDPGEQPAGEEPYSPDDGSIVGHEEPWYDGGTDGGTLPSDDPAIDAAADGRQDESEGGQGDTGPYADEGPAADTTADAGSGCTCSAPETHRPVGGGFEAAIAVLFALRRRRNTGAGS